MYCRHCFRKRLVGISEEETADNFEKAADYIIHTELNTNAGNGGLIAVDKLGNIAMPYNSGGMFRGFLYKEKGSPEIKKGCGIGKKIVVVGEK